jgi:hypothetical protein
MSEPAEPAPLSDEPQAASVKAIKQSGDHEQRTVKLLLSDTDDRTGGTSGL